MIQWLGDVGFQRIRVGPAFASVERMRVQPKAEVRLQAPVFQVMAGLAARPREIGNFVAVPPELSQTIYGSFIELRDQIVGWNAARAVTDALEQDFVTEAAAFVHFKDVDGDVGRIEPSDPIEGFLPGGGRLAR